MSDKTKVCSKCGNVELLSHYPKQGNQCLTCRKEYAREYRERPEVKDRIARRYPSFYHRAYVRVYEQNKKAKSYSLPHTLTTGQWQHALNYFNGCCAICDRQFGDLFGDYKESIDHWIPVTCTEDSNPGTTAKNIVPLCQGRGGCNNSKGSKMPNEWLEREFGKRKAKQIAARIQSYFDSLEVV